jgi:secondary thiamine-phosphate synthase enzyme
VKSFEIRTSAREEMIEITSLVAGALAGMALSPGAAGACLVYVPHTTAGVTINENADPDVKHDMLAGFSHMVPELTEFRHAEGNSTAHIKASLVGFSAIVPLSDGKLALGQWQGIQFCEFDGPRRRRVCVSLLSGPSS